MEEQEQGERVEERQQQEEEEHQQLAAVQEQLEKVTLDEGSWGAAGDRLWTRVAGGLTVLNAPWRLCQLDGEVANSVLDGTMDQNSREALKTTLEIYYEC